MTTAAGSVGAMVLCAPETSRRRRKSPAAHRSTARRGHYNLTAGLPTKQRRRFSPQFKAEAVQLVVETGKPIAEVARDLGIHDGILGNWVNAWRREHPEPDRDSVAATVRVPGKRRGARRGETRTYATSIAGLQRMADWLAGEHAVILVGMEGGVGHDAAGDVDDGAATHPALRLSVRKPQRCPTGNRR